MWLVFSLVCTSNIWCMENQDKSEDQQNYSASIGSRKKTTIKRSKKSLGKLNVLPKDMILQIIKATIDWNAKTRKDAFGGILSFLLLNKYSKLITKRNFSTESLQELFNVIQSITNSRNNAILIAHNPWLKAPSNSLKEAIKSGDNKFLKKIIPSLFQFNLTEHMNYDGAASSPFELLCWIGWYKFSNKELLELVELFLNNDANPNRENDNSVEGSLLQRQWDVARLIIKKINCNKFNKLKNKVNGLDFDSEIKPKAIELLRYNHQCAKCKFE